MKCSGAGFCDVVYAMHRFLKICVLLCVYLRIIIIPGLCLRFMLLNVSLQLMYTYSDFYVAYILQAAQLNITVFTYRSTHSE